MLINGSTQHYMSSLVYHPRVHPFIFTLYNKFQLHEAARNEAWLTADDELQEAPSDLRLSGGALCIGVFHGCSIGAIKTYLEWYGNEYEQDDFKNMMRIATPALFYAIGRNAPEIITLLLEYGLNPSGLEDDPSLFPPIAFAVIHGELEALDTTKIVEIL
jgi:hypothetical protein